MRVHVPSDLVLARIWVLCGARQNLDISIYPRCTKV